MDMLHALRLEYLKLVESVRENLRDARDLEREFTKHKGDQSQL